MATNYNNEFCVQCETFTYKGDGIRLEHNGSWRTFCTTCAAARQANKNTAVSRAAYRNRQPKLFTEEVITMDTNPITNPEEGTIMYTKEMLLATRQKAQNKMQELLAQANAGMTYELESKLETIEAILDEIRYGFEYLEDSGQKEVKVLINNWALEPEQTSPKEGNKMKKECLHKLQNKICKFCGTKEADLYAESEKILEEWHNQAKEHIWPVEIDIAGQDKHGRVLVTCTRCNGSGECSFHLRFGTTCFGCSGTGVTLDPLMTQPQIKFIRQLFKSVKDKMTIDEQEELIEIMKSAINGTKRVNKHWASQTIDKLKNLETERSIS